ncbi:heme-binding protein [Chloroflexota bacterium]
MTEKPIIDFAQSQAALKAMVEQALQTPDKPVAIAIVDDTGNLLAFVKMDNLRLFARRHAIRKAYTAAITGMDSGAHAERLKERGLSVSDFGGDPNLTPGQGGVAVRSKDGIIMGGIGVGGYPSGQTDEDLAKIGLKAMNL